MKIDHLGLPQDNGASDLQDSARLAGVMTVFDWPQSIPIRYYCKYQPVLGTSFMYVRHPEEIIYSFSRDQFVCLIAAYFKKGMLNYVNKAFVTGRDIMPPSVKGHIARCQGRKATWLQDLWLKGEIIAHAKLSPTGEPNQLLCMLMVAGPEWVKMWVRWNPKWQESINAYWRDSYRNEPELAALMIQKITALVAS